jgi:hypothetical protein
MGVGDTHHVFQPDIGGDQGQWKRVMEKTLKRVKGEGD